MNEELDNFLETDFFYDKIFHLRLYILKIGIMTNTEMVVFQSSLVCRGNYPWSDSVVSQQHLAPAF